MKKCFIYMHTYIDIKQKKVYDKEETALGKSSQITWRISQSLTKWEEGDCSAGSPAWRLQVACGSVSFRSCMCPEVSHMETWRAVLLSCLTKGGLDLDFRVWGWWRLLCPTRVLVDGAAGRVSQMELTGSVVMLLNLFLLGNKRRL